MEAHGGCGPLPIAALSLHAFAPSGLCLQGPVRPAKAIGSRSSILIRDGLRSHPIDAKLLDDVVDSERAGQPSSTVQPQRQLQALTRLMSGIPGALSRLVSTSPSQSVFAGSGRLSDMRVFPSAVPKHAAARGGASIPGAGAARRAAVMWFRNDLRLHDNPSLDRACREGTSVLPVYVFDPRDYGKAPNGFGRTGPARAQFILDAVSDLRSRLRAAGSDLLVRVGKPEVVVPELAAAVGAGAVYCQAEVTEEEMQVEGSVRAALERDGCELQPLWGGTLYQLEDLPFKLSAMPTSYADFRARVSRLSVRPLVASERGIKGLPQATGLEAGKLPSLQQLGVIAVPGSSPQQLPAAIGGGFGAPPLAAAMQSLRGGETEALKHLSAFMSELKAALTTTCTKSQQKLKQSGGKALRDKTSTSIASTTPPCTTPSSSPSFSSASSSFSCRISPWLALGCLSPRRMYLEMKHHLGGREPWGPHHQQHQQLETGKAPALAGGGGSSGPGGPANWLVFELLWRDFFRFATRKYAAKPQPRPTVAATSAGEDTAVVASRVAPPRSATATATRSMATYALSTA